MVVVFLYSHSWLDSQIKKPSGGGKDVGMGSGAVLRKSSWNYLLEMEEKKGRKSAIRSVPTVPVCHVGSLT